MSASLSQIRVGRFTSSDIHLLRTLDKKGGFGKPALSYIKAKRYEKRLGRSIHVNAHSRPLSWGHICELIAFDKLGTAYSLNSDETIQHPAIDCLCGSPDGFKYIAEKTVIDIKSPFTLTSFCGLVEPIYSGLTGRDAMMWIRNNHDSGEAYYWQLVSNAMITGCSHAELVIFCPYESELDEIRKAAADAPPELSAEYYWLQFANTNELPYLIEGGHYKNLNIIRFELPEEDKRSLEFTIREAEKILHPPVFIAHREEGVTIIQQAK